MSDLTPVLRYLKSWGQHDAYDRVLAARDRIDFQAEVIDSQARHIEELHGQRNAARRSMGLAKEAYTADLDAALATIERLREAIATHRSEVECCTECSTAVAVDRSTPDGRLWAALADTEERTDG